MVCGQVRAIAENCGADEILVAGIGAPLFARELGATDLTTRLGEGADALPALAVRELAKKACLQR